jgi:uncharacterized protein (TIGR03437 family)
MKQRAIGVLPPSTFTSLMGIVLFFVPTLCRAQGLQITTVAGCGSCSPTNLGDGGQATSASLLNPAGLAVDVVGDFYIADRHGRIRKVSGSGLITTVAGGGNNGVCCFSGDGGPATGAQLNNPSSVAVDAAGNMYIADTNNNRIRKVSNKGIITTVAGGGSTLGDEGPATSAKLDSPGAVTLDATGNLFIADTLNQRIRKVSTKGTITTVAGTGICCALGDGGSATSAYLERPSGVAVDAKGNLYVSDTARIRKVSVNGTITTLAGNGTLGYSGDGGPASFAALNGPTGLALDSIGDVYVADYFNNRIREILTDGTITTVAGAGNGNFSGDGGPAISASLFEPVGVVVAAAGNVLVADSLNQRIRLLKAAPPDISAAVNGASFVPGGIVPGQIATIFGTDLTSTAGIDIASSLPLPTNFLNVAVAIDGFPAPLFAVDNVNGQQQINVQVPWEIGGKSITSVVVATNGLASAATSIPVLESQPGIFGYGASGQIFGAILHATFQLADTGHPATAGETVLIYCTGLGAVFPQAQDGAAATGAELTVGTPTVTIGEAAAVVTFSGLAPGFVGLNQINAQVPSGLASGNQPVVITIGGASSSPVLLPVH